MRAVVQTVLEGCVEASGRAIGRIGKGLLVYVSIAGGDSGTDVEFIADKLVNMRIFADDAGKMNKSVTDVSGSILLVSNFTLHGDCRKGRRPDFENAAEAEKAKGLYNELVLAVKKTGAAVETGDFGAYMQVNSINDGPVTMLLDSSRLF